MSADLSHYFVFSMSNSNLREQARHAVSSRNPSVDNPLNSSQLMTGIAKGGLAMPNMQPGKPGNTRSFANAKSRPISKTPSLSRHTIDETDQIDPIDYEEYVSTHSERDSLSRVLNFPEDDIDVNLVQRKIRTEQHVLPEEQYEQLDPAVQNCVDCYTSDWVVVNRKYQQYSTSQRSISGHEVREAGSLVRQQYECDSFSQDITPQEPVNICLLLCRPLYFSQHVKEEKVEKGKGRRRNFRKTLESKERERQSILVSRDRLTLFALNSFNPH